MATKKPGTAVIPWEQEMAAAAKAAAAQEQRTGGNSMGKLGIRGGILTVDDNPVPGNELDVIVLNSIHHNTYYTGRYDVNVKQIPVCYSFGDHTSDDPEPDMAPHEQSKEPQDEGNGCATCWANAMGTADTGRGKACKNSRNLAVISADVVEHGAEAIEGAEVRVLSVPVMSTKFWGAHVKRMNEDMQRPYWGVVTRISVVPDPKSQFLVKFSFVSLIEFDGDTYQAVKTKREALWADLTTPYQEPTEAPAPPARGPARKTVPIVPAKKSAPAPVPAKKSAPAPGPAKKTPKY